jgi:hypothetical protein
MLVRCHCGSLASSERSCAKCGSDNPMWHSHCDEMHVMPSGNPEIDAQRHTIYNCAMGHMHPHKGFHDHSADGETMNDEPPKRIPFKDREAYFLTIPWVTRVRGNVQCEGICWGKSSMSRRVRCKKKAKYHYRPLKKSMMERGKFCWDHVHGFDMDEDERIRRWTRRNPPPWTGSENNSDRDADDRRNLDSTPDAEA